MTMGEESNLYGALTMPIVISPVLDKLEQKDMAATQTLRSAFTKLEKHHPGSMYDFVRAILEKAEVHNNIDMCETLLRLEGNREIDEFHISRPEEPFRDLNARSTALKKILSRIPEEIFVRKEFLETIKEIANAIRQLLDAVSAVSAVIHGQSNKQRLDHQKREFVKYSKKFSNTLKAYFKDSKKKDVFTSANHLINQTNLIMDTVKSCL
ncbi:programmed cell death protein 10-like [Tubulanus polymorphus]|uniref:programmed cell death protein 10-like n=1 Tax=Tubulanus polymorphus TaxID=672921 RepID=UPI003DA238C1